MSTPLQCCYILIINCHLVSRLNSVVAGSLCMLYCVNQPGHTGQVTRTHTPSSLDRATVSWRPVLGEDGTCKIALFSERMYYYNIALVIKLIMNNMYNIIIIIMRITIIIIIIIIILIIMVIGDLLNFRGWEKVKCRFLENIESK